jgi:hypothetical protein
MSSHASASTNTPRNSFVAAAIPQLQVTTLGGHVSKLGGKAAPDLADVRIATYVPTFKSKAVAQKTLRAGNASIEPGGRPRAGSLEDAASNLSDPKEDFPAFGEELIEVARRCLRNDGQPGADAERTRLKVVLEPKINAMLDHKCDLQMQMLVIAVKKGSADAEVVLNLLGALQWALETFVGRGDMHAFNEKLFKWSNQIVGLKEKQDRWPEIQAARRAKKAKKARKPESPQEGNAEGARRAQLRRSASTRDRHVRDQYSSPETPKQQREQLLQAARQDCSAAEHDQSPLSATTAYLGGVSAEDGAILKRQMDVRLRQLVGLNEPMLDPSRMTVDQELLAARACFTNLRVYPQAITDEGGLHVDAFVELTTAPELQAPGAIMAVWFNAGRGHWMPVVVQRRADGHLDWHVFDTAGEIGGKGRRLAAFLSSHFPADRVEIHDWIPQSGGHGMQFNHVNSCGVLGYLMLKSLDANLAAGAPLTVAQVMDKFILRWLNLQAYDADQQLAEVRAGRAELLQALADDRAAERERAIRDARPQQVTPSSSSSSAEPIVHFSFASPSNAEGDGSSTPVARAKPSLHRWQRNIRRMVRHAGKDAANVAARYAEVVADAEFMPDVKPDEDSRRKSVVTIIYLNYLRQEIIPTQLGQFYASLPLDELIKIASTSIDESEGTPAPEWQKQFFEIAQGCLSPKRETKGKELARALRLLAIGTADPGERAAHLVGVEKKYSEYLRICAALGKPVEDNVARSLAALKRSAHELLDEMEIPADWTEAQLTELENAMKGLGGIQAGRQQIARARESRGAPAAHAELLTQALASFGRRGTQSSPRSYRAEQLGAVIDGLRDMRKAARLRQHLPAAARADQLIGEAVNAMSLVERSALERRLDQPEVRRIFSTLTGTSQDNPLRDEMLAVARELAHLYRALGLLPIQFEPRGSMVKAPYAIARVFHMEIAADGNVIVKTGTADSVQDLLDQILSRSNEKRPVLAQLTDPDVVEEIAVHAINTMRSRGMEPFHVDGKPCRIVGHPLRETRVIPLADGGSRVVCTYIIANADEAAVTEHGREERIALDTKRSYARLTWECTISRDGTVTASAPEYDFDAQPVAAAATKGVGGAAAWRAARAEAQKEGSSRRFDIKSNLQLLSRPFVSQRDAGQFVVNIHTAMMNMTAKGAHLGLGRGIGEVYSQFGLLELTDSDLLREFIHYASEYVASLGKDQLLALQENIEQARSGFTQSQPPFLAPLAGLVDAKIETFAGAPDDHRLEYYDTQLRVAKDLLQSQSPIECRLVLSTLNRWVKAGSIEFAKIHEILEALPDSRVQMLAQTGSGPALAILRARNEAALESFRQAVRELPDARGAKSVAMTPLELVKAVIDLAGTHRRLTALSTVFGADLSDINGELTAKLPFLATVEKSSLATATLEKFSDGLRSFGLLRGVSTPVDLHIGERTKRLEAAAKEVIPRPARDDHNGAAVAPLTATPATSVAKSLTRSPAASITPPVTPPVTPSTGTPSAVTPPTPTPTSSIVRAVTVQAPRPARPGLLARAASSISPSAIRQRRKDTRLEQQRQFDDEVTAILQTLSSSSQAGEVDRAMAQAAARLNKLARPFAKEGIAEEDLFAKSLNTQLRGMADLALAQIQRNIFQAAGGMGRMEEPSAFYATIDRVLSTVIATRGIAGRSSPSRLAAQEFRGSVLVSGDALKSKFTILTAHALSGNSRNVNKIYGQLMEAIGRLMNQEGPEHADVRRGVLIRAVGNWLEKGQAYPIDVKQIIRELGDNEVRAIAYYAWTENTIPSGAHQVIQFARDELQRRRHRIDTGEPFPDLPTPAAPPMRSFSPASRQTEIAVGAAKAKSATNSEDLQAALAAIKDVGELDEGQRRRNVQQHYIQAMQLAQELIHDDNEKAWHVALLKVLETWDKPDRVAFFLAMNEHNRPALDQLASAEPQPLPASPRRGAQRSAALHARQTIAAADFLQAASGVTSASISDPTQYWACVAEASRYLTTFKKISTQQRLGDAAVEEAVVQAATALATALREKIKSDAHGLDQLDGILLQRVGGILRELGVEGRDARMHVEVEMRVARHLQGAFADIALGDLGAALGHLDLAAKFVDSYAEVGENSVAVDMEGATRSALQPVLAGLGTADAVQIFQARLAQTAGLNYIAGQLRDAGYADLADEFDRRSGQLRVMRGTVMDVPPAPAAVAKQCAIEVGNKLDKSHGIVVAADGVVRVIADAEDVDDSQDSSQVERRLSFSASSSGSSRSSLSEAEVPTLQAPPNAAPKAAPHPTPQPIPQPAPVATVVAPAQQAATPSRLHNFRAGAARRFGGVLDALTPRTVRAQAKISAGRAKTDAAVGTLITVLSEPNLSQVQILRRFDRRTGQLGAAMRPMTSRSLAEESEFKASVDRNLQRIPLRSLIALHASVATMDDTVPARHDRRRYAEWMRDRVLNDLYGGLQLPDLTAADLFRIAADVARRATDKDGLVAAAREQAAEEQAATLQLQQQIRAHNDQQIASFLGGDGAEVERLMAKHFLFDDEVAGGVSWKAGMTPAALQFITTHIQLRCKQAAQYAKVPLPQGSIADPQIEEQFGIAARDVGKLYRELSNLPGMTAGELDRSLTVAVQEPWEAVTAQARENAIMSVIAPLLDRSKPESLVNEVAAEVAARFGRNSAGAFPPAVVKSMTDTLEDFIRKNGSRLSSLLKTALDASEIAHALKEQLAVHLETAMAEHCKALAQIDDVPNPRQRAVLSDIAQTRRMDAAQVEQSFEIAKAMTAAFAAGMKTPLSAKVLLLAIKNVLGQFSQSFGAMQQHGVRFWQQGSLGGGDFSIKLAAQCTRLALAGMSDEQVRDLKTAFWGQEMAEFLKARRYVPDNEAASLYRHEVDNTLHTMFMELGLPDGAQQAALEMQVSLLFGHRLNPSGPTTKLMQDIYETVNTYWNVSHVMPA